MDADSFDRLARALFSTGSRRGLTRALAGLGIGAGLGAISPDDTLAKKCGPCLTKKKGECKKKRPNGTRCPGGQCFKGLCNPGCCGAGCATRCAANEVCADPANERCGFNCEACFDPCGCGATFDTEIGFCFVKAALTTACATPQCDSQGDCAPNGFCTLVLCDQAFVRRCLDSCPT